MSCNRHLGFARANHGFGGVTGVQRAFGCGFDASRSHLDRKCGCPPNVVRNITVKEYPIVCPPPKQIAIDRVTTFAGIDNAVFLVGDVQGYKMNEDFNMVISDDIVGLNSFNMPAYALLKDGDLHTLSVTSGDFVNHPVSAFIRQNQHMFHGGAADLFEMAPQDFAVESDDGDGNCMPPRIPHISVIRPTSLNIRYITILVAWWQCGQHIKDEYFYIIPIICQNANTAKGANIAAWDDNLRTCGEKIRIPVNSTDNGSLKLADVPTKCGCPPHHGLGRATTFGGFRGTW